MTATTLVAAVVGASFDTARRRVVLHLECTDLARQAEPLSILLPLSSLSATEITDAIDDSPTSDVPNLGRRQTVAEMIAQRAELGAAVLLSTTEPRRLVPPDGPVALAVALRALADYLDPLDISDELRTDLGMPARREPNYGPAGRAVLVDRLEADLTEHAESIGLHAESADNAPSISTFSLVIGSIWAGVDPQTAIADYGLLDG